MKKSIQVVVAEEIAKSGSTVEALVVEQLVNVEINKRKDIILKALPVLRAAEGLSKKPAKADKSFVQIDGKMVAQETYTEASIKEAEGNVKKYNELQAAFDDALNSNTDGAYNKLSGLIGSNKADA